MAGDSGSSQNFLKVLVDPTDADVDIVAIHGLNPKGVVNHAYTTWTAQNGKLWLRDFLPAALPKARVLIFGYNSNVAVGSGNAGVREYAENLIEGLRLKRKAAEHRPLVFVCHSLGGLVLKRALILAASNDKFKSIKSSTRGLVFFATPHQGGQHVPLGKIAASIARVVLGTPKNSFLDSLEKDGLFADELRKDFRQQLNDYYILSFVETRETSWAGIIVDKNSATFGLPSDHETIVMLDGNHSGICRFEDAQSTEFETVSEYLVDMIDTIKAASNTVGSSSRDVASADWTNRPADTPSSAHQRLPVRRNGDFVGRQEIMDQLTTLLKPRPGYQCRAALYGLGGIGKTQIALEFGYRQKQRTVYWVYGGSDSAFLSSYAKIIPASSGSANRDIVADCTQVQQSLESRTDWLVIVDNLDDVELKSLHLLPQQGGATLFTVRDRRAAEKVCQPSETIRVGEMNDGEAVDALSRLINRPLRNSLSTKAAAMRVLQLLGNIPIAISQAAAYMRNLGISLEAYEKEMSHILDKDDNSARDSSTELDDTLHGLGVRRSWQLTHDHIKAEDPAAMRLLCVLSMLDTQSIPREFLVPALAGFRDVKSIRDAEKLLIAYSLVLPSHNDLRIHALVAKCVQLDVDETLLKQAFVDAATFLAKVQVWTFSAMLRTMRHCRSIISNALWASDALPLEARRSVLGRVSWASLETGDFDAAKKFAEQSIRIAVTNGLPHRLELHILGGIASLSGNMEQALSLVEQAATGCEEDDTLDNLAKARIRAAYITLLLQRNREEEAIQLVRQYSPNAAKGREAAENAVASLQAFGMMFFVSDYVQYAREVLRQALDVCDSEGLADSRAKRVTTALLWLISSSQEDTGANTDRARPEDGQRRVDAADSGHWPAEETLNDDIITELIRDMAALASPLGLGAPLPQDVAPANPMVPPVSLASLASILMKLTQFGRLERLVTAVVAYMERVDHPRVREDILVWRAILCEARQAQNKSEDLLERIASIKSDGEKLFGKESIPFAKILYWEARALASAGLSYRAYQLAKDGLAVVLKIVPPDSLPALDAMTATASIAALWPQAGDKVSLAQTAYQQCARHYPYLSDRRWTTSYVLADAHASTHNFPEAMRYYKEAQAHLGALPDPRGFHSAALIEKLGLVYLEAGIGESAASCFIQVLHAGFPATAAAYGLVRVRLSRAFSLQEKWDKCWALMEKVANDPAAITPVSGLIMLDILCLRAHCFLFQSSDDEWSRGAAGLWAEMAFTFAVAAEKLGVPPTSESLIRLHMAAFILAGYTDLAIPYRAGRRTLRSQRYKYLHLKPGSLELDMALYRTVSGDGPPFLERLKIWTQNTKQDPERAATISLEAFLERSRERFSAFVSRGAFAEKRAAACLALGSLILLNPSNTPEGFVRQTDRPHAEQ